MWAFLEQGHGKVPPTYIDYKLMKEMGWSYQELMECPAEVTDDIIRFMNTEAKFGKVKNG